MRKLNICSEEFITLLQDDDNLALTNSSFDLLTVDELYELLLEDDDKSNHSSKQERAGELNQSKSFISSKTSKQSNQNKPNQE